MDAVGWGERKPHGLCTLYAVENLRCVSGMHVNALVTVWTRWTRWWKGRWMEAERKEGEQKDQNIK